jgi:hypothetical protein
MFPSSAKATSNSSCLGFNRARKYQGRGAGMRASEFDNDLDIESAAFYISLQSLLSENPAQRGVRSGFALASNVGSFDRSSEDRRSRTKAGGMRLIQYVDSSGAARVGRIDGETVIAIADVTSTYELAVQAIAYGATLEALVERSATGPRQSWRVVACELPSCTLTQRIASSQARGLRT